MRLEAAERPSSIAEKVRVVTATRRITPEGAFFPCRLLGRADAELARGIRDDLHVTALIMDVGTVRSVFVSVELIDLDRACTTPLRARIAKSARAAFDAVHIAAVHTSAAPTCVPSPAGKGPCPEAALGYAGMVAERIAEAVNDCVAQVPIEVSVHATRCLANGFYANCRSLDETSDQEVFTLEFRDVRGRSVAGMFGFSCHSTVLGPSNREVSADLAGYLASGLSLRWGVRPVCMLGACGDMSSRPLRSEDGTGELVRVGAGVLDQIGGDDEMVLELHEPTLATLALGRPREGSAPWAVDPASSSSAAAAELVCTLMDFGDLRLITVPAEPPASLGIQLKAVLDAALPICWCHCDYNADLLADPVGAEARSGATWRSVARELIAFIERRLA